MRNQLVLHDPEERPFPPRRRKATRRTSAARAAPRYPIMLAELAGRWWRLLPLSLLVGAIGLYLAVTGAAVVGSALLLCEVLRQAEFFGSQRRLEGEAKENANAERGA